MRTVVDELREEVRVSQSFSSAIVDVRADVRWKAAALIEELVEVLTEARRHVRTVDGVIEVKIDLALSKAHHTGG